MVLESEIPYIFLFIRFIKVYKVLGKILLVESKGCPSGKLSTKKEREFYSLRGVSLYLN